MDEVSCCCEFGYELQLVIPYAYYLYTKGLLNKTTSSKLTRELYYFSSNHHEIFEIRNSNHLPNIPNKIPHIEHLNYQKYLPPPYNSNIARTMSPVHVSVPIPGACRRVLEGRHMKSF